MNLDKIVELLKGSGDPLSTFLGVILGYCVIAGVSPVELLDKFLTLPGPQYVRLLSGIVLMLCCYYLFKPKTVKKDEQV